MEDHCEDAGVSLNISYGGKPSGEDAEGAPQEHPGDSGRPGPSGNGPIEEDVDSDRHSEDQRRIELLKSIIDDQKKEIQGYQLQLRDLSAMEDLVEKKKEEVVHLERLMDIAQLQLKNNRRPRRT